MPKQPTCADTRAIENSNNLNTSADERNQPDPNYSGPTTAVRQKHVAMCSVRGVGDQTANHGSTVTPKQVKAGLDGHDRSELNRTLEHTQAVESLQDWVGELHVLGQGEGGVVPPANGVSRRDHGTSV